MNNICDKGNGQCTCRIGMKSRNCADIIEGSFAPSFDFYSYQVS